YVAATKAQSEIAPLYPTHVTSIRDYMFTGLAARTDDGALVALAEALGVIGALDDTQAAAVIPELLQPHNLAKPALHAPAAAALGQIGAARTQFATPVFDALVTLNNTADNAGRIGIVKAMSAMALQGNQWVQPTLTHMEAMIPGSNTPLLTAMADVLVPIAERHARFSNEIARILNVMQQSANGSAASKIRSALNDVREVQQLFNQQNHGQTRARLESELPAALTNEAAARAMWPDAQSLTQAPDAVTRRKAAEILTQLGRTYGGLAAEGVTTLATLNKDMDPGVRLAVTQGLGMLGMQNPALAADILVALQPLTLDTDPMVAGLAVNAVGMLGARNPDLTDEATAILTPAAQSTDTMVRGNANNHLQKLAP
ncbi:MAG: hypothetical protein KJ667_03070, partial [Alphaproteobacteria bacterium]|nr:hypothetical protein [Alphaproteobacteria bacterium]